MSSRSLLICQGRILLPEGEFPRGVENGQISLSKRRVFRRY
ncbi:MAG: hypothetical protein ACKO2T_14225 [Microcystis aeruginosa]